MAHSDPDTIGSFLFGQARASRVRFWHIASLLLCQQLTQGGHHNARLVFVTGNLVGEDARRLS
jgi:hypothetical protein